MDGSVRAARGLGKSANAEAADFGLTVALSVGAGFGRHGVVRAGFYFSTAWRVGFIHPIGAPVKVQTRLAFLLVG